MKIEYREIIKFGGVGVINTVIDFGLLNLLVVVFGWGVVPANTVSFTAAVMNSYFLNKYFTFREKGKPAWLQFGTFFAIALIGLVISNLLMHFLAAEEGWHYNLAKAVSAILVFAWNYIASKMLVFRPSTHNQDYDA